MRSSIHSFDTGLTEAIQSLPSWSGGLMHAVSLAAQPVVTIAIIAGVICYGAIARSKVAIAGVVAALTFAANGLLKLAVQRDRPIAVDLLDLHTFSFPSGHAAGATLAYGLLAILLWKVLPRLTGAVVAAAVAVFVVLVGLSRVYLGVHYPSDVVAGWIVGCVGLAIIAWVMRRPR